MNGKYFIWILLTVICLSCQNRAEKKSASKQKVPLSLSDQLKLISPVIVQSPNFDGSILPSLGRAFPILKFASKKRNQITDEQDWFVQNQISLPIYKVPNQIRNISGNLPKGIPLRYKGYIISDGFKYDTYNIFFYGVNFGEKRFAMVTDGANKELKHFLDFENFNYAPKTKIGDEDFVFQSIQWASIENNVLFISHGHPTYAKSTYGKNAYISAINLENYEIIWTSEPLTCNSTFTIVDSTIICGYGFTAETDYLFVLDKHTGARVQKIRIDKGPSYVIQKGNKILVRTYDLDYEFHLK
ncbi:MULTISPECIES: hypothetical protein [unclassified Carboxylicivirga]|uniref:hypothetical protein n=1 Tax=Carboxylicivirga TaxID=1628153 RepID=UPI003D3315F3